ncbi:MAG: hypothetical protein KKB50_08985 [Planctomycetes bacterium]|nr:hypothetical protein [Planctomycetota bacterium]
MTDNDPTRELRELQPQHDFFVAIDSDAGETLTRYDPAMLRDGWSEVNGERVFYVSNPGLGPWALRERFGSLDDDMTREGADAG